MKKCPVCKSSNFNKYAKIGKHWYFQCLACKSVYLYPKPTKKELDIFYKKFDYKDLDLSETRIRKDAIKSIKFFSNFVSKSANVLDIGCGRGYFLDEMKRLGWLKLAGLDYSNVIVDFAREKLKLNVFVSDIYRIALKKKYDLIILNQVIEHLDDYDKVIKKLNYILNRKGYVYIATPNILSALALVHKSKFEHLIPQEHTTLFNKNSLSELLTSNGFRIVKVSTWGYPENMAGLIKSVFFRQSFAVEDVSKKQKIIEIKPNINFSLKHYLFDKLFCTITYRLLDVLGYGINIQILAQKQ